MPVAIQWILLANVALILWTLGFGFFMAFRRVTSVKAGRAPGNFYVAYNSAEEPTDLAILTRQYANLHENPVIFYAVSALSLATGRVDMAMAYLATAYVVLRILHSVVHITVNAVMLRFALFLLAALAVTAMAIKLALVAL